MSCKRCGRQLESALEYCSFCGTPVSGEPAAPNRWQRPAPPKDPAAEPQSSALATAAAAPAAEPVVPAQQAAAPATTAPARHSRPAPAARPTDWLLVVRLLAALATLAIGIMSYVATRERNPSEWLFKWGVLKWAPTSITAYKGEMIFLIVLSAVSLLVFLARADASQFFALLLGLAVMGIVTSNILDWDLPHQAWAYLMTQNLFITTWICLGLALISALSVIWPDGSARRVGALVLVGGVITGGAVAIISSFAPTLPNVPLPTG